MSNQLTAREFEARFRALVSGVTRERANDSCIECERCTGCSFCTVCKGSERLRRCHFCVRCDCIGCVGLSGRDLSIRNAPSDRKSYFRIIDQLTRELGT